MSYIIVDEKAGIIVQRFEEPSQDMMDLAVRYHRLHQCGVSIYEKAGEVTEHHVEVARKAEADETLRRIDEENKRIDAYRAQQEAENKATAERALQLQQEAMDKQAELERQK